jgi:hypothetical protein
MTMPRTLVLIQLWSDDNPTQGSAWAVEVDLMAPIDENKSPKPHIPCRAFPSHLMYHSLFRYSFDRSMNGIALNHFGLWVDDIEAAVKQLTARGMRFAPGGIRKVTDFTEMETMRVNDE